MRRAFTLIEMLIVITLIVMLIAILLPVLKNAKISSKMVICKSNLRQVGIGVLAYCKDNDDLYPNGYVSGYTTLLPNADGEYGRTNVSYSWAVYQKDTSGHQDMVAILADYYGGVDGMRATYMCGFMQEGYEQKMKKTNKLWYGTNSGQQPFALMWNLQGGGTNGIKTGMYRLGERWQQANAYQNYDNMWYNIIAGDVISPNQYGGGRANHWNLGNPTPFKETTGSGGFELAPGEPTNGNFLTDDGAVANHNNMQRDQPHVGGTTAFMVPGDYATLRP